MAEQNRGERLRQFMQWRQQAGGGRFGRFQGGMGGGQFGGGGRLGRFQGGMGGGQLGRFQGGMGPGNGVEFPPEDIHAMDAEQRTQYRRQLEFRIDWLEKRLTQAVNTLEELDALEAAEAGQATGAEMSLADPFAASKEPENGEERAKSNENERRAR